MSAEEAVPRLDAIGRRIHSTKRGPKPGNGPGRSTEMLQVRIPKELYVEVAERGKAHPHEGSRAGTGKSHVVIDALELLFGGDADRWRQRYRHERALRLRAENQLARIRHVLGEE